MINTTHQPLKWKWTGLINIAGHCIGLNRSMGSAALQACESDMKALDKSCKTFPTNESIKMQTRQKTS